MKTLKKHHGAIGYTLDDLKGISPTLCMKEVVRNEKLKLLEAGIIYPIAGSKCVSPTHYVPKKGGITVVPNDKNELIPQRIVTGYRMVIDFRKLKKLLGKIIIIDLLLIKCQKDYQNMHTFAF